MILPRKLFVNVYPPFAGQIGVAYPARELADQMAGRGRLACIEVVIVGCEPGAPVEVAQRK